MANHKFSNTVAVIVAHPDDETLWAGGTILQHPDWQWFIISVCRGKDEDRAPKFRKALTKFHAEGIMGDMNDGSEQQPLDDQVVAKTILDLLPNQHFDIIITHNSLGEYTKHLRHEEVSKAVINLWNDGKISTNALWIFAYEDGNQTYLPRPNENATLFQELPEDIWLEKYKIMTETYGFNTDTWEAKTTPKAEAFWHFHEVENAKRWLDNESFPLEILRGVTEY